jgi:hypothetical protein
VKPYQSAAQVRSLIPSLIHPRALASIGVYRTSLSRQVDLHGQSCTMIRNPEKRKVSNSIPLLVSGVLSSSVYGLEGWGDRVPPSAPGISQVMRLPLTVLILIRLGMNAEECSLASSSWRHGCRPSTNANRSSNSSTSSGCSRSISVMPFSSSASPNLDSSDIYRFRTIATYRSLANSRR